MKIINCKVNHVTNPVGYDMSYQTFSWKYAHEQAHHLKFTVTPGERCAYEAKQLPSHVQMDEDGQVKIRMDCVSNICSGRVIIAEDETFIKVIHDSGILEPDANTGYALSLNLEPCTRYYWKVAATQKDGQVTEGDIQYFETGKMNQPWSGKWIAFPDCEGAEPIVRKTFHIPKKVKKATGYMCGLGLYECYLNESFVNDGFILPGYHNYNMWQQYQTFDLTESVLTGDNALCFLMGAGWYKGRFGINGGTLNTYGEQYQLLCEIQIEYEDGTTQVIASDTGFDYTQGPVALSNIYDGEIYDAGKVPKGWLLPEFVENSDWKPAVLHMPEHFEKLSERLSVPVVNKETVVPVSLLTSPSGVKILDMGQNMTGWIVFEDIFERGQTVTLRHGELMEDGELCQTNLKDARQAFVYTSAGEGGLVRPHFTYYGFRYVALEGFGESLSPEMFKGWNLYSDLETVGEIKTGNADVNQFIKNAYWSQRNNFLDHPTDCPQRSERLGWTGDAQMYCPTACYTMDCAAFYRKYMRDVNEEQSHHNGIVSFIVPKADRPRPKEEVAVMSDMSSAAWSDVATIIPWTLYLYYGDKNLLAEQYPGMKAWVDAVIKKDEDNGGRRLWQSGFHFGDWLALDNPEPGPFGLTDKFYIASCYYFYSTKLTAKAAAVIGNTVDAAYYGKLAEEIRLAILNEYFDSQQVCKIDTQTGYVLPIFMDIVSAEAQRLNGLRLVDKIKGNGGHLDTGFVGTPYLCRALTKSGQNAMACSLLLREDYPSWLYQVKRGATTVWESWDALDDHGKLTGEASLNHYAFGSIVEWLYADICGIGPMEEAPGFKTLCIKPHPDAKLRYASASVDTQAGKVSVSWEYNENGSITYHVCY